MVDQFVTSNIGKGKSDLTFFQFREYVIQKYQKEIAKFPLLKIELEDLGYEGGSGIGTLYNDVYLNFAHELDSGNDPEDIEGSLETMMHDYFIDMKDYYKLF